MKRFFIAALVFALLAPPFAAFAAPPDANGNCPPGQRLDIAGAKGGTVSNCVVMTAADIQAQTGPDKNYIQLDECTGIWGGTFEGSCWIGTAIVTIGAGIVDAVSVLPWLADKFLDLVVANTVDQKGFAVLYGNISNTAEFAWTMIRDLINILIIGVFVFVAIGIILGLKEYGEKKLIAKILIVAILINFSFLFTRLTINFSNSLAGTLYANTLGSGNAGTAGNTNGQIGVGQKFLKQLQVINEDGTYNAWNALANTSNSSHSTGSILIHVFVTVLVSLGAAVAIFYIALLLAARFIVLVLLLIVSSAAFGAYLLPSTSHMWSKWWNMLLKNSIVAPILFIFLFISLSIAESVSNVLCRNSCSADAVTTQISNAGPGVNFMLNYVIVLGFLFAGIYIANSLSTSFSRRIAVWGTTNATGILTRGLGFTGRNTIGRGANNVSKNFQARAKAAQERNPGGMGQFTWDKLAQGIKSVAKRDFNAGNLTGIKGMQSKLGGFEGQEKRRKDAIAERAKRNTYTKDEVEASKKAIEQARTQGGAQNDPEVKQKEIESVKRLQEAAENMAQSAAATKKTLEQDIQTLGSSLDRMRGTTDPEELERVKTIEQQVQEKKNQLSAQDKIIEHAKTEASDYAGRVVSLSKEGENLRSILNQRAQELMPKGAPYIANADKADSFNHRVEENAVADAYQRFSNILNRAMGQNIKEDKWAQSMRKSAHDFLHHEDESKALKKLVQEVTKASDKAHTDATKLTEATKENH